jgi:hypothetical protein
MELIPRLLRKRDRGLRTTRYLILAVAFSAATTSVVSAQELFRGEPAPLAEYHQVIDAIFPRNILGRQPSEFILTLRFLPPRDLGSPSQIIISGTPNGGYMITRYSLADGSSPLWEQITRIQAQLNTQDTIEIAKHIQVRVEDVSVPSALVAAQIDRLERLQISPRLVPQGVVHVDATEYQMWFQTVGASSGLYLCTPGAHYAHDENAPPIVRWMNDVKGQVDQYAKTH